jgi:phosphoribosylanthranilate isomerase
MQRRTWIKVCGMTRAEDVHAAADLGVDAIGLVFAESPRRLYAEQARRIIRDLSPHILRFGVFVDENPAEIARIAAVAELDRVQLHGFEDPMIQELVGTRVVKAFRARDAGVLEEIATWGAQTFFLDAWSPAQAGGTGKTFDWSIAKGAATLGRLILAGGLSPENVAQAIHEVRPFGVDVSSGVESSPGVKDRAKMRAFVEAVREADAALSSTAAPPASVPR